MGMKVTYTCDRCKEEHKNDSQLWALQLKVGSLSRKPGGSAGIAQHFFYSPEDIVWCRKCIDELQLFNGLREIKPMPEGVKTPTREEQLMAIIEEMVQDALDNQ